jgi:Fe-S-cluster-containing hydrogenase component 2
MTCPYGAILPFFGKAIKCDQCLFTEKPACVRACPHNAIVFMEKDEFSIAKGKMKWHEGPQREAPLMRAKY